MPRFHFGDWVENIVKWLTDNVGWLFDAINSVLTHMYNGVDAVLGGGEPLLMAGIFAVLAFWLRGLIPAVLTFVGFALIDSLSLWDDGMETLSLVIVAAAITIVIAVPLGIWAARNAKVGAVVRPVLDVMQTMPAFVYLIPGVMFFGVGVTPGVIATIVFAMPPGVRMTELGIRQVDGELVEAAEAFGSTPRNILRRVQLPSRCRPSWPVSTRSSCSRSPWSSSAVWPVRAVSVRRSTRPSPSSRSVSPPRAVWPWSSSPSIWTG